MKVFGVGMMKTGTTSLASCLRELGFRHFTYYPKLIRQVQRSEWDYLWDVVERYDSFEDNPWPMIYEQLDERYPDARFILTERRDGETWFASLAEHAKRMGPTAERVIIYGHALPQRHKAEHIEQYEAHNARVRAHFADRPGKLLEVCWETGTTRHDVADFLGVELPASGPAAPWRNRASEQGVMIRFWLRNTTKYVLISKLGVDPFRNSNLTR
jgi:hypothetical protein